MADDDRGKAFDFAQETTKQLLTLSTGVIALTITFLKDVASEAPAGARDFLHVGWALFFVSIIAGVGVLMTLTGNLASATTTVYTTNIRIFAAVQVLAFLAAVLCTLVFGWRAL
jgi:hypothetical protein